jgi:hypothetical protein
MPRVNHLSVRAFSQVEPGEHFWTNLKEGTSVYTNPTCYHPEGLVFSMYSYDKGGDPGLSPLFRFYHTTRHIHFYSLNLEEGQAAGYLAEGICGWVRRGRGNGAHEIYRWVSPTGLHFYTADPKGEAAPQAGYKLEGVAFFAWNIGIADMNIIRFYCPTGNPTPLTPQDKANWENILLQNSGGHPNPPTPQAKGSVVLINGNPNQPLYAYLVLVNTGASTDIGNWCQNFPQQPIAIASSNYKTYTVPAGKTAIFFFYSVEDCSDRVNLVNDGFSFASSSVNGSYSVNW